MPNEWSEKTWKLAIAKIGKLEAYPTLRKNNTNPKRHDERPGVKPEKEVIERAGLMGRAVVVAMS